MTTLIDWVTPKKIAEDTGLSRSMIMKLVDEGAFKFKKKSKNKNSSLMISISSFNKYWERKR